MTQFYRSYGLFVFVISLVSHSLPDIWLGLVVINNFSFNDTRVKGDYRGLNLFLLFKRHTSGGQTDGQHFRSPEMNYQKLNFKRGTRGRVIY